MYKKKAIGKRILSVFLATVLAVPLLTTAGVGKDMSRVQAATLGNPRKASDGTVTWDCVWFGVYPQTSTVSTSKDPIKWRVLSVNGDDAFLLADSSLDVKAFNEKAVEAPWETSTIRSWLNGYGSDSNGDRLNYSTAKGGNFIGTAFNQEEKGAIKVTDVDNAGNEFAIDKKAGTTTKDKIFLLSCKEMLNKDYGFAAAKSDDPYDDKADNILIVSNGDKARIHKNTAFAGEGGSGDVGGSRKGIKDQKAKGVATNWWLRTPGIPNRNPKYRNASNLRMTYVSDEGDVIITGQDVEMNHFGVCPALHLDLSNAKVWSYAGTVDSNGKSTDGDKPPVRDEEEKKGDNVETTKPDGTVEIKPDPDKTTPEEVEITTDKNKEVSIADEAYMNNTTIKSIKIDGNVTSIGKNAFKGCTNLKTVVIGNKVLTIGEGAFSGCTNLTSVTIGSKVTNIKAKAFYKCTKLKKITIPYSVKKIGKQAFYGCKSLKSITVKTLKLTKKSVGSKAFKGTHSKATVKVPGSKLAAYKKLLKSKGMSSKAKYKK